MVTTLSNLCEPCLAIIKKNAEFFKFISIIISFRISSDNNSRKFSGTTQYTIDDPHLQRIHLLDTPQHDGLYEVKFTKFELISSGTFCKGISNVIERKISLYFLLRIKIIISMDVLLHFQKKELSGQASPKSLILNY